MDFFELLLIALFILFPILDGVLKQRKKGQGPPGGLDEVEGSGDVESGRSETGQDRAASEMLPDDLWELMTGERRDAGGRPGSGGSDEPWSVEAESSSVEAASSEVDEEWSEPWAVDDEVTAPELSMEYEGPEAYSLETPAPPPIERTVPTAEARHRAFHELIDRPRPKRKRRMSPLMRSLRSPDGLRQAVLLREILGPPKGLE